MILSKFGTFGDVRINEHRVSIGHGFYCGPYSTRHLLLFVFYLNNGLLHDGGSPRLASVLVSDICWSGGTGEALAATVTAAAHCTVLSDTKPQLRWDGALPEPDRPTTPSRNNLQRANRRTRHVLFWLLQGTRLVFVSFLIPAVLERPASHRI